MSSASCGFDRIEAAFEGAEPTLVALGNPYVRLLRRDRTVGLVVLPRRGPPAPPKLLSVSTISIGEAGAHQVDALTALMHESQAYQGEYASILEGYRLTPAYLERHPTFVATAGETIVGFYGLVTQPPELDLLFVADTAQGLGVGAALVAHMLDQAAARGMTAVRVVSHPPAVGFYKRVGARQIGVVPPRPPKITWPRPELVFDIPARPWTAGKGAADRPQGT
ncbi:GNAT family N-acetyltransferase [Amycolatopsis sp. MEPSY49]|uniref:GNAT family N-acetyltransferase n=1 Tax=Amycolatopsis sp. MEPSY49 TaxID=3151600 RepID=UPI003EFA83CD